MRMGKFVSILFLIFMTVAVVINLSLIILIGLLNPPAGMLAGGSFLVGLGLGQYVMYRRM